MKTKTENRKVFSNPTTLQNRFIDEMD